MYLFFFLNTELESKLRKAAQARVPSDPNVWQQMRENLETILVEDHDFSEQHDIEFALWQLHYKRIEDLRSHSSTGIDSYSCLGCEFACTHGDY